MVGEAEWQSHSLTVSQNDANEATLYP